MRSIKLLDLSTLTRYTDFMKEIALITGATAGFGKAAAELFAENGHDLILTGRREERLLKLKKRLEVEFGINVLPLCFDVRSESEVNQAISSITGIFKNIGILINNLLSLLYQF